MNSAPHTHVPEIAQGTRLQEVKPPKTKKFLFFTYEIEAGVYEHQKVWQITYGDQRSQSFYNLAQAETVLKELILRHDRASQAQSNQPEEVIKSLVAAVPEGTWASEYLGMEVKVTA